ncbi:ParB/RepB/Spo0J family partition protein [Deinococcus hopiensis]|uniref:Chromosome partitioning protein, ParB family n=1 Tax=Deinococcus hopiensis KR-140 TaxID=695939 RepID=A0A1W1UT90_9DEIO|nr:ParB/RepB/Spo0J family partition protein [Deinococcus hopiensis]SMB84273.1 chromosome partitioning protein, ParB family [Deinococcus hopiensis KR-140]
MSKNRFARSSTGMDRMLQRSIEFASVTSPTDARVIQLPLASVVPNPRQPRRTFDEASLRQLAESIRERGVLQPLLVRPLSEERYEIVYGERRWRAAKLAGVETVPSLVRDLSDEEAELVATVENLQREDLNRYDEVAFKLRLIARLFGTTSQEAAQRLKELRSDPSRDLEQVAQLVALFTQLGREQWLSFVTNGLPVLNLPEVLVQAVQGGTLEYSKALLIARAPQEHQPALLRSAVDDQVTHLELREQISALKRRSSSGAELAVVQLKKKMTPRVLNKLTADQRTRAEALIQQLNEILGE